MKSPAHYLVTTFAMLRGIEDYTEQSHRDPEDRGWMGDMECACQECKSSYAAGWAMARNYDLRGDD